MPSPRFALPFVLLLSALALAQAPAPTTFTEHVAPIVFRSCTPCHRPGEVAPFPLQTYDDLRKRGSNVLAVVEDRFMPPWHPAPGHGEFRGELRLTEDAIATLRAWVDGGMPEGPPAALPPLPAFPDGWQLGEPDLVVTMPEAFPVPAGGPDIYRSFVIPLALPEDRWVRAIEVRPSARSVLHHIVFDLDATGAARAADGKDGRPGFAGMRQLARRLQGGGEGGEGVGSAGFGGWAVGGMPQFLPDGLATRLPAGADLVLNSHFHPSGKAEQERTTIGLYFADAPPQRSLVGIQLPPFFGVAAGIDIPAGDADWRLADSFVLPCDVDAVTVGGHAHMLCRSLRLWATLPDGAEVPLLWIPAWDFDWQNRYTYRELVPLPTGATLHAELRYDNSADNPSNPFDPPRRVRWGRESTDEMGSITLLVTPRDEADLAALQAAVRDTMRGAFGERAAHAIERRFAEFDRDGDGFLRQDEVPRRLRRFFGELDQDGDGALTPAEARRLAERLDAQGRLREPR